LCLHFHLLQHEAVVTPLIVDKTITKEGEGCGGPRAIREGGGSWQSERAAVANAYHSRWVARSEP
jgi:hypothetical protein